jgi:penicillin amidase
MAAPQTSPGPDLDMPSGRPASRPRRRWLRGLLLVLALLVVVLVAGVFWVRGRIAASLPRLDGDVKIAGLSAPVAIERDARGVPTIHAANRLDVARATGFLHAQERFFQMDLLRRSAAGELSELFGPVALKVDQEHRLHRLRDVARRALAHASPRDRAVLDAYAAGVGEGLATVSANGAPPFEYLLLRMKPAPWKAEDSILAVLAMYMDLEDPDGRYESEVGLVHDRLPAPLADFLAPAGTEWDAPLVGGPLPAPPLPGPEVFDLRHGARPAATAASLGPHPRPLSRPPAPAAGRGERGDAQSRGQSSPLLSAFQGAERRMAMTLALSFLPSPGGPGGRLGEGLGVRADPRGSNNWAVAGAHTADGHALLANDMHLGLSVPNTWYRMSWEYPGAGGENRRITGVTLPGTPLMAVGSTGRVAWGFTNSYVDWYDLVVLETDPRDPERYRTPQGWMRIEHHAEPIRVKGKKDQTFDAPWTIWGPVLDHDSHGRPRAIDWIAHHPDAVDLNLMDLEEAHDIDEAIRIAHRSGIPPQNFTVADAGGRIGWTVVGHVPKRIGFDGRTPASWADGSRRWDGWLADAEVPKVVDPPSGRIWTANTRTVEGADFARIGDGGTWLGARAHQIRDDLLAIDRATPRDLLAIQLDDRALFLTRWRRLLLDELGRKGAARGPGRAEMRRLLVATWDGRASVDSVAYRLVKEFRSEVAERALTPLFASCKEADPEFDVRTLRQYEGPLWRLVSERPLHLLEPRYGSWDDLLLASADAVIAAHAGRPLAQATWGDRNTLRIRHPFSGGLPGFLARYLDIPTRPIPGDADMPRFQAPAFGASERIVVSPGHEETGIFHMPVGQSGHPMSPNYRDGERDWEEGRPTPFLPGPAVHRLRLVPAS